MVAVGNTQKGNNIMSETRKTDSAGKAPTHIAYQIRDGKGDKGYWTCIGAAWQHKDGSGFNIQLESVPLDGRITLRIATEKKD
jgi:hypothetical protein